MRFKLINKETIVTRQNIMVLRVMAVTEPKAYSHCKMLGNDPVKLQRQVGKHKFETFATAKDILHAGRELENYISNMTCGQPYARI